MTGENQTLSSEIYKAYGGREWAIISAPLGSVTSSLHPGMKHATCAGCVVLAVKGYSLGE